MAWAVARDGFVKGQGAEVFRCSEDVDLALPLIRWLIVGMRCLFCVISGGMLALPLLAGQASQPAQGNETETRAPFLPHLPFDYSLDGESNAYPDPKPAGDGHYWWKGNLHTHTVWSDGDQFPEVVTQWYLENGYHFLALSDHNILSQGEKWINPETNRFLTSGGGMEAVEVYRDRFGDEWVEIHEVDEELRDRLLPLLATAGHTARRPPDHQMEIGDTLVRLKPLNEFRAIFERSGRFILIEAEEITQESHVIHVNATNIVEFIEPQTGQTVEETIRLNINAVHEQSARVGRPILPHLNHPNFRWAVTAEDMARVETLNFFEVYNGHRSVKNFGDETHINLDRMWDIVLTKRLNELDFAPLYGLAVDDSHNHAQSRSQVSRPGRGWVMVRSQFLTPEHLIGALRRGDFYSSSGVTLSQIDATAERLSLEIDTEGDDEGTTYTVQFIGTRKGYNSSSAPVTVPKLEGKIADITGRWLFVQAVADRETGEQILRVYDQDKDRWEEASVALEPGETRPTGSLHLPSHPENFPFQGDVAEARFWHKARTQSEAEADKAERLGGDEPGLAAYWRFDDKGDEVVPDQVGGADITRHGGTFQEFGAEAPREHGLRFSGMDEYGQVSHSAELVPGTKSFTIEMWVKTDPDARRWNLPFEWRGGDRIYVGHDVGYGWNFAVTTDGLRTDTYLGESGEVEEIRTTRRYSDDVGEIFKEVKGDMATYEFEGDEIYVRARVISSQYHPDPSEEGERKKAWVQPVVPGEGLINLLDYGRSKRIDRPAR
jgi:hypothetical protein